MDDRVIHSPLLPGGDLVAAALDRRVMGLADRGGASGLVGARWADLCAEQATGWVGQRRDVPGVGRGAIRVTRVARLAAAPAIAATAARRHLQNPDLLLVGEVDGRPALQAADAKFSVETARPKQVSAAVVEGLLTLGPLVGDLLGDVGDAPALVDGVFLCPDYPLTHLMFRRRHGIVRAAVRPEQVAVLPAPADVFFRPLEGAAAMATLAGVDALPVSTEESLLAALYYFRLARAAVGCWLDATGPLLTFNDRLPVDEGAVVAGLEERIGSARSALDLVLGWHADVETVRAQRAAVDQVATLPLGSRDLRELGLAMAEAAGTEPPSANKVRRRLAGWYRGQLRERLGPIEPPVADLGATLREVARVAASLAPAVEGQARTVIAEFLAAETAPTAAGSEPEVADPATGADGAASPVTVLTPATVE